MDNDTLNATLRDIARVEGFRRDTPMLFKMLDRLQEAERELQAIFNNNGVNENENS